MKKRAPSLLLALLALAGLLTAGGCSLGRSPRPDFYMLSSPVENVVQSGKEKISGPRVAIGPVSIPGYLDRPQLFLRDGNDVKVELAEFNHWSEPFGEGVTRVLCDAVSASLTPRKGLASPMRSQQPFQWRIAVDIARFDGAPNGSVILDAGWSLVNESGEELKSGRFVQEWCGKDYYSHDVLFICGYSCAGHKSSHTSGGLSRACILSCAGFPGHEGAGNHESSLCGYGTGVLHTESWDRSYRNFRKLY